MSGYNDTQLTRPCSETIGEAAARLHLRTLLRGAKHGSVKSMIVLSARINDSYQSHASEFLDALLPHLDRPPAMTEVHHTVAAYTVMGVLSDIFEWYNINPAPTPATRLTDARVHECLDNFVYWSRRLLDGCNAKQDQPRTLKGYETIGRFLYTLFLIPGNIPRTLSMNVTMLEVAVNFATQTHQGFPIIHPCGRRSPNPSFDQPDGPSAILGMLGRKNAKGVVNVILKGSICTPETFVERIVHRMRCYTSLSIIKRLADVPEDTPERVNVFEVVSITCQVMRYDQRLRDLFMEAKAPELYVSALAKQLRIASALPDSKERADILVDIALWPIRWWEMIESEGALVRAKEMAGEGMYNLIGSLLPYSQFGTDRLWAGIHNTEEDYCNASLTIGDALAAILPYSLYPNVLSKSATAMELRVLPQVDTVPRDSPYREALPSLHKYLRNCERLLPRDKQEPLCDNLNHFNIHLTDAEDSHHTERICSGCHSVAYCSRRCQKEDWAVFHRVECGAMRASYFERRFSHRRYPFSYRRFHVSMLRYAFESQEVAATALGPNASGSPLWLLYSPRKVNSVDPLRVINPITSCCTALETWVGREAPLVPDHLRPRFDAFLRAFTASFQIPMYQPGSLRLVTRVSPMGNEDVSLLMLLRQTQPMLTMKGSPSQVENMVEEYTLREPRTRSNYEIVGSFAGHFRKRRDVWEDYQKAHELKVKSDALRE